MGASEISGFISNLAVSGNVAASTQNQALNAIIFLYKHVLNREVGELGIMERAKKPVSLPAVLTQIETQRLLGFMSGTYGLMAKLIYGCGLRLMGCVRLRVKDIEFEANQVIVRDGKGMKA